MSTKRIAKDLDEITRKQIMYLSLDKNKVLDICETRSNLFINPIFKDARLGFVYAI